MNDFQKLLKDLLSDDSPLKVMSIEDLVKELPDCGDSQCRVHGEHKDEFLDLLKGNPSKDRRPANYITEEKLQQIDASRALDLSVAAAASASNNLAGYGESGGEQRMAFAERLQEQAFLWSSLHEKMDAAETRTKLDKQYEDTLRASIRQELNEIYGSELTELRESNTKYRRDMQRMTDLREDDAETLHDLQTEVEGIAKQRDEYRDASIKGEAAVESLQSKVAELERALDAERDTVASLQEVAGEARPVGDDVPFT